MAAQRYSACGLRRHRHMLLRVAIRVLGVSRSTGSAFAGVLARTRKKLSSIGGVVAWAVVCRRQGRKGYLLLTAATGTPFPHLGHIVTGKCPIAALVRPFMDSQDLDGKSQEHGLLVSA